MAMTDRHVRRNGVDGVALDPHAIPEATHSLHDARPRARVVVSGTVTSCEEVAWVGGPVLEVTLLDGTGSLTLVFFGRDQRSSLDVGRSVTATGTVGTHLGRRVLLNPQTWLVPLPTEPPGRRHRHRARGHHPSPVAAPQPTG
jgi:RecG-like helicase